MLKTALAAALIAGAATSSAFAGQTQFLFETPSGGDYCDGLLLTIKGKIATGTHNSPQNECTEGDYAGGFEAKGYGSGVDFGSFQPTSKTEVWSITTEDINNLGSGYYLIFNLKDKTWSVGYGGNGVTYQVVNDGPLGTGDDLRVHKHLGRPAFKK
jgi:hypothetical protein